MYVHLSLNVYIAKIQFQGSKLMGVTDNSLGLQLQSFCVDSQKLSLVEVNI